MYVRHSKQFEDCIDELLVSNEGSKKDKALEILAIIQEIGNSEVCTGSFSPENLGGRSHLIVKLVEFNQKQVIKSPDGQRISIIYEIKPIEEFSINQSATWRVTCVFDVTKDKDDKKTVTFYVLTLFDKDDYNDPDAPYKLRSQHGSDLREALSDVGFSHFIPSTTRNYTR